MITVNPNILPVNYKGKQNQSQSRSYQAIFHTYVLDHVIPYFPPQGINFLQAFWIIITGHKSLAHIKSTHALSKSLNITLQRILGVLSLNTAGPKLWLKTVTSPAIKG